MSPRTGLFVHLYEGRLFEIHFVLWFLWGRPREFSYDYDSRSKIDRPVRWFRWSWHSTQHYFSKRENATLVDRYVGRMQLAHGVTGRSLL